ncbi:hypothetical protein RGU12_12105 [Fredinandcohnia sp. QZ13]|nr:MULTISPECIES: hypothetical protein [Bacillaceae]MDR4888278.1 hypothetical protein [Fredinandcohnia sp. QZ13]
MKQGDKVVYNNDLYEVLYVYENGMYEIKQMEFLFKVELVNQNDLIPFAS